MKIKILEKSKAKDFDLEIILVNKIEELGEKKRAFRKFRF